MSCLLQRIYGIMVPCALHIRMRYQTEREKRMKYSETKIDHRIRQALADMGFETMTPIQELAIPELLIGKDIIGQAQTGTGKTAAFGIPMIQSIAETFDAQDKGARTEAVQGLILCPTRELAIQAAEELKKMAKNIPALRIAAIYGGQDIGKQFYILKKRVSIVVGTPGRVMDHMRRGTLHFDGLKMLVLDEADEMLNMGFREDIETICQSLPEDRQTALFSATMPEEILEIARMYQRQAKLVQAAQEELTIPLVKQFYYIVKGREKDTALCRLLDYMSPRRALIFCNTKKKVDQLTLLLKSRGYCAEAIHGDLSQHQRDRVMNLFRGGSLELLLATDVAARGIDVDDVDMVFNYDMPQDMEYYVHRIGRTGRAGKRGKAVSLITRGERYKIASLEEYCNTRIREKDMPTAGSAMTVKAYRSVTDALDYCRDKDLTPYMKIVYKRCVDDGCDPLEVAAAFLRQSLGEIEPEAGLELSGRQAAPPSKSSRTTKPSKGVRREAAPKAKAHGVKNRGDHKKKSKARKDAKPKKPAKSGRRKK